MTGFEGAAFYTAACILTRQPGPTAPGLPKTLFGQDRPKARQAVSNFFRIEKIKLRAAIRKIGEIPSRRPPLGRRQAGFKRISRVKI